MSPQRGSARNAWLDHPDGAGRHCHHRRERYHRYGLNPAAGRLFDYSSAEPIGQNVKVLMPLPHRESRDACLARYRETGEKRVIGIGHVVVGRRKGGTTFPARLAIGETEFERGGSLPGFSTTRHRAGEHSALCQHPQKELVYASRLSAMGGMARASRMI